MSSGRLEITFLGTGTSHGVPMIGCDCPVCRSEDPRDRRNRSSVALRASDGQVLLIDTPPELRLAAIACDLKRVDAALLTHAHADHIMGMDDLRRFNDLAGKAITCYGSDKSITTVRRAFGYAEVTYEQVAHYRPSLRFETIDSPICICGLDVIPVPLMHGDERILGFRIGGFAYCTDCSAIPDESMPMLEGLELLVLDALRHKPHATHMTLSEALAVIERLRPAKALLTHISHHLPHRDTEEALPPLLRKTVALAYDGLRVTTTATTS